MQACLSAGKVRQSRFNHCRGLVKLVLAHFNAKTAFSIFSSSEKCLHKLHKASTVVCRTFRHLNSPVRVTQHLHSVENSYIDISLFCHNTVIQQRGQAECTMHRLYCYKQHDNHTNSLMKIILSTRVMIIPFLV